MILFIILPSTIFPSKFSKDLIIYSNERGWLDASKFAWLRTLSLKGVDRPPAAILILSTHRLHSFLPTERSIVVDRSSNIETNVIKLWLPDSKSETYMQAIGK